MNKTDKGDPPGLKQAKDSEGSKPAGASAGPRERKDAAPGDETKPRRKRIKRKKRL